MGTNVRSLLLLALALLPTATPTSPAGAQDTAPVTAPRRPSAGPGPGDTATGAVEGFFVCGAGRNATNAHYKRCDTGAEYSTACLSLRQKEVLYFDAVAPYNWQLYTYFGPFKATKAHYRANVSDYVDPPRTGWYVVGDGISPPPTVVSDRNASACP